MLEENNRLGLTPAGNRRHPSRKNALDWIKTSWDSLKPSCILNVVDKYYMNPGPGQVIEAIRKRISPKESKRTRNNFKKATFLKELPREIQQVFFQKHQYFISLEVSKNFDTKKS